MPGEGGETPRPPPRARPLPLPRLQGPRHHCCHWSLVLASCHASSVSPASSPASSTAAITLPTVTVYHRSMCTLCVTVQELLQVLGAGAGARCGPHCVRTRTRPLLPPAQETLASAAPRRWRLLLSAANSGNCPRPLYISTPHSRCCI